MANNRLKELIAQVESASESLGQVSTELSNHIAVFERFLDSLKGKVEVEVKSKDGVTPVVTLRFERDRSGWALFVRSRADSMTTWLLGGAPIGLKARAVALFEALLTRMLTLQAEHQTAVAQAASEAAALVSDLPIPEKEGK